MHEIDARSAPFEACEGDGHAAPRRTGRGHRSVGARMERWMTYDDALAERVRWVLADIDGEITEP